jgi:wyosine [tRNA(Phe)-imidazoG37] synthetase (radical SAM superfamily)
MKHVFGPVPSRRLGRSLGIDPVPLKTCNLSCVYCQLGRTRPMINERREFYSAEDILSEIEQTLSDRDPGSIDWLTFVGAGETVLHSKLGWLVRKVKTVSDLPVAVITNGSLLHRADVREELMAADAVLPSLDAATSVTYGLINRPHRSLTIEHHTQGLTEFRRQFAGSLWLEVMLVRGINDTEGSLNNLGDILSQVQPDEIQINVPTRPTAEPWVEAPDRATLVRAEKLLGGVCDVLVPTQGSFELPIEGDILEGILSIIIRHPLSEPELLRTLRSRVPGGVLEALAELSGSGLAKTVERFGTRFWCAAGTRFPEEDPMAVETAHVAHAS